MRCNTAIFTAVGSVTTELAYRATHQTPSFHGATNSSVSNRHTELNLATLVADVLAFYKTDISSYLSPFLPQEGTPILATNSWVLSCVNPPVNNDTHLHGLWSGKNFCYHLMTLKAMTGNCCTQYKHVTRLSIWLFFLPT